MEAEMLDFLLLKRFVFPPSSSFLLRSSGISQNRKNLFFFQLSLVCSPKIRIFPITCIDFRFPESEKIPFTHLICWNFFIVGVVCIRFSRRNLSIHAHLSQLCLVGIAGFSVHSRWCGRRKAALLIHPTWRILH